MSIAACARFHWGTLSITKARYTGGATSCKKVSVLHTNVPKEIFILDSSY